MVLRTQRHQNTWTTSAESIINILPVRHGTFNILLPHSQQELEPNLVVIKDYIVLEKDKTTSLCQWTELERKNMLYFCLFQNEDMQT